ncbi:unnamed protein product [Mytilus coruscus]|uniref:Uncharacterized protein n=1 Tax=Mytilus coruscus TaxID=42192 RepID=A0A6J7ZX25_MYTCO|nr:unnamed protein product [Mytilus coruscus]
MAYVFDGRKVAPEDSGDKDTLKGRMSQIKINKDMTSERNMMDFFLENEEDLEDSFNPQRQQQCCNAPNIVQMDEHTEQCQNCGAQSMKPRFENQAEESERRGKMEGDIDMQGHAIHNLPEGTRADEPVTKGWYAKNWQDLVVSMQGKINALEGRISKEGPIIPTPTAKLSRRPDPRAPSRLSAAIRARIPPYRAVISARGIRSFFQGMLPVQSPDRPRQGFASYPRGGYIRAQIYHPLEWCKKSVWGSIIT